jgi:thiamine kinase-like enzyme
MSFKKTLKGNSGCRIELLSDSSERFFVRKISSSIEYNERLENQIIKQEFFEAECFQVPKIFEKGRTNEGLVFFDMEFIPGKSLSEYMDGVLPNALIDDLLKLINQISQLGNQPKYQKSSLVRIKAIAEGAARMNVDRKICNFLLEYSWDDLKAMHCHGDLTLENLLVTSNGMCMIDFQDAPIESLSQDISKLLFDIEFGWSNRHDVSKDRAISVYGNQLKVIKRINTFIEDYPSANFFEEITALQILNAVRVLPYIQDEESDKVVRKALDVLPERLGIL